MGPRELFLEHLATIEKATEFACRRNRLSCEEAEDFASVVKLKLIEDDYAVIRKYEGRASLETYLGVVVIKAMLDYLSHLWGKWRPSKKAQKLGRLAERLEELLVRDGYGFDQACEILRTNHKVMESPRELAELRAKLPPLAPRGIEGEEELRGPATEDGGDPQRLRDRESEAQREKAVAALRQALRELPAVDCVIARMYGDGLNVVTIAMTLGLQQKPLCRRIERIFNALRKRLEADGLRREDIEEVLERGHA